MKWVVVLETMTFRLAAGADEEAFLAVDKRLQTDFAYQQPGLLRRTTAHSVDGQWIVLDLWASAADADACAVRWESDPIAAEFMAFVDRDTVTVVRYELLE